MTLLSIKNLSVAFQRHDQDTPTQVVHGVSFDIKAGETFALVGESGSGKSVTAHSILGLLPYPAASHPSGEIFFEGEQLLNRGDKFLRTYRGNKVGMIFQEPMTALNPLHTIERQIAEPLLVHAHFTQKQARSRVRELLNLVGFDDIDNRLTSYPHQLSGGQRQRVMIAMALACSPKLLIADEPTTALDVTVQMAVLKLIKDLQSQFNMGLLLISHDLAMVKSVSENIAVMRHGEIVEHGNSAELFKNPQHPYTKLLIDSEPAGHPEPVEHDAPTMITGKNIRVAFERKRKTIFQKKPAPFLAVDDLDLDLVQGETLGIVGESGSGKSTLAYALLKLLPSTGNIVFQGQNITKLSQKAMRPLRQKLQIIFQDPFSSLNPRMTVEQIIAEGLRTHRRLTTQEISNAVESTLIEVGLSNSDRFRYPHEFSGGQRQRIAIARAIILRPDVLVLDEPTSALDRSIQADIIALLRNLQQKHKLSYLFISHDLKVVKAMSHRVIVMKNGHVVETGTAQEVISNPKSDYAKALMQAAFWV